MFVPLGTIVQVVVPDLLLILIESPSVPAGNVKAALAVNTYNLPAVAVVAPVTIVTPYLIGVVCVFVTTKLPSDGFATLIPVPAVTLDGVTTDVAFIPPILLISIDAPLGGAVLNVKVLPDRLKVLLSCLSPDI